MRDDREWLKSCTTQETIISIDKFDDRCRMVQIDAYTLKMLIAFYAEHNKDCEYNLNSTIDKE